jgi:hypothetical protein
MSFLFLQIYYFGAIAPDNSFSLESHSIVPKKTGRLKNPLIALWGPEISHRSLPVFSTWKTLIAQVCLSRLLICLSRLKTTCAIS